MWRNPQGGEAQAPSAVQELTPTTAPRSCRPGVRNLSATKARQKRNASAGCSEKCCEIKNISSKQKNSCKISLPAGKRRASRRSGNLPAASLETRNPELETLFPNLFPASDPLETDSALKETANRNRNPFPLTLTRGSLRVSDLALPTSALQIRRRTISTPGTRNSKPPTRNSNRFCPSGNGKPGTGNQTSSPL